MHQRSLNDQILAVTIDMVREKQLTPNTIKRLLCVQSDTVRGSVDNHYILSEMTKIDGARWVAETVLGYLALNSIDTGKTVARLRELLEKQAAGEPPRRKQEERTPSGVIGQAMEFALKTYPKGFKVLVDFATDHPISGTYVSHGPDWLHLKQCEGDTDCYINGERIGYIEILKPEGT